MKRSLAILLLLIFTVQVLPIREMGKMIYSVYLMEECCDMGSNVSSKLSDETNSSFFSMNGFHVCYLSGNNNCEIDFFQSDEVLIKILHMEVPSKPPNV